MATYEITLNEEQLSGLLTEDKGLHGLVETVLNQVLAAQVTEQIGARLYARSTGGKAYRNGYRPRTRTTRVEPLVLHVPQVRDGSFSPTRFARYQRREQALGLALMAMVLPGVSTRADFSQRGLRPPADEGVVGRAPRGLEYRQTLLRYGRVRRVADDPTPEEVPQERRRVR